MLKRTCHAQSNANDVTERAWYMLPSRSGTASNHGKCWIRKKKRIFQETLTSNFSVCGRGEKICLIMLVLQTSSWCDIAAGLVHKLLRINTGVVYKINARIAHLIPYIKIKKNKLFKNNKFRSGTGGSPQQITRLRVY